VVGGDKSGWGETMGERGSIAGIRRAGKAALAYLNNSA